jgi:hypothetical protein
MTTRPPTAHHNSTDPDHGRPQWTVVSQSDRGAVTARGAAYGLIGLLIGAIAGFIIGANIGGNWFTSFSIGSLHGYEATAWIGAAAGGILVAVLTLWLAHRRHSS